MANQPELKTLAYETVRDYVLDGVYAPGQVVGEEELARRLAISRTPVRAALDRLAMEGLVRAVRGSGFIVEELTARTLREVFEFRQAVETFAVRHGQPLSEASRAARLLPLFEVYAVIDEDPSWPEQVLLTTSDSVFHRDIMDTLDNRIMSEMHRRQLEFRTEHLQGSVWGKQSNARVGASGHLAIGRALLAGHRDAAETELTAHLSLGLTHITEASSRHVSERYRELARRIEALLMTWLGSPDDERTASAFIDTVRGLVS
jgi:DNA-binding GntR family transcriptional regulator